MHSGKLNDGQNTSLAISAHMSTSVHHRPLIDGDCGPKCIVSTHPTSHQCTTTHGTARAKCSACQERAEPPSCSSWRACARERVLAAAHVLTAQSCRCRRRCHRRHRRRTAMPATLRRGTVWSRSWLGEMGGRVMHARILSVGCRCGCPRWERGRHGSKKELAII